MEAPSAAAAGEGGGRVWGDCKLFCGGLQEEMFETHPADSEGM